MNAAFFLTPKPDVAYLYSDCSVRQGLERMKRAGYAAIPVIDHSGFYIGTIREGDFLWYLVDRAEGMSLRDLENVRITELIRSSATPPERITVSIEKIVERAVSNNFVPIVDDSGVFIGIVTRGRVMQYLSHESAKSAFSASV